MVPIAFVSISMISDQTMRHTILHGHPSRKEVKLAEVRVSGDPITKAKSYRLSHFFEEKATKYPIFGE
jgi:hypothetical protein